MTRSALPRLWPTLVVLLLSIPALALASGLGVVVGLLAIDGELPAGEEGVMERLSELLTEPAGVLVVLLPSQLALLLIALGPAAVSSVPFRERLGLVRWKTSHATTALLLLSAPIVQVLSTLPVQWLGLEMDEQIEFIGKLIGNPQGPAVGLMLVMTTLGAGVTEELLFRGFIQTRLLARWSALPAILLPGLFFAAMHMSPVHALAVLPLGLWFGFVAWRTGSVLPAIAAHALNNLLGVGMALLVGDSAQAADPLGWSGTPAWYWVLVGVSAVALIGAARGLRRDARGGRVPPADALPS